MNHRFGAASYALMHDFWLADEAARCCRESPGWEHRPPHEREAELALLLARRLDARRAVAEHPPWVMTPDEMADGATIRIVAALGRELDEVPASFLTEGAKEGIKDAMTSFIAAELRRVLFDRGIAEEHEPASGAGGRARLNFEPAVLGAALGAARAKLLGSGESADGSDQSRHLLRWRRFGLDVIRRYEREKRLRGWLGWYHRWRGGGW